MSRLQGLVCLERPILPAWQARCLEQLVGTARVELTILLAGDRDVVAQTGWRRELAIRLHAASLQLIPLDDALAGLRDAAQVRVLQPLTEAWPAAAPGADFALDLRPEGAARLPERPLRYGVWRFHLAQPIGVGEVLADEPTIAGRLVATDASGAVVLEEGVLRLVDFSLRATRDSLLFDCATWPARVCTRIALGGDVAQVPGTPAPRRPKPPPPVRRLLLPALLARNLGRRIAQEFIEERWNIGVCDAPVHDFLGSRIPAPVHWLPNPDPRAYLADPWGLEHAGKAHVLAERYDFRAMKGAIVALAATDARRFAAPRVVLDLPVHLSYPALCEHEGEIYCIPEKSVTPGLTIYRADDFPGSWTPVARILDGWATADNTVFRHAGRWWLLCTRRDDDQHSRLYGWNDQTKLYAWHAEGLCGPWQPHPLNPLKCDVRSSRPAGPPFVHAGRLYRPAQDCSRRYGGAVVINQVEVLTPTAFCERPVARVAPEPCSPYPDGLHTLAPLGQRTLIDGKIEFVSIRAGLRRLGRTLLKHSGLKRGGGRAAPPPTGVMERRW